MQSEVNNMPKDKLPQFSPMDQRFDNLSSAMQNSNINITKNDICKVTKAGLAHGGYAVSTFTKYERAGSTMQYVGSQMNCNTPVDEGFAKEIAGLDAAGDSCAIF